MPSPIAITPGDPAGIGPDLCLQLAREPAQPASWFVIADPSALAQRARALGLTVALREYRASESPASGDGQLHVLPMPLSAPAEPGRADPAHAAARR